MKRRVLQNISGFQKESSPTIRLVEGDVGWEEAYQNWIKNKNPTNSSEWKKGVFLLFEDYELEALPLTKVSWWHSIWNWIYIQWKRLW